MSLITPEIEKLLVDLVNDPNSVVYTENVSLNDLADDLIASYVNVETDNYSDAQVDELSREIAAFLRDRRL